MSRESFGQQISQPEGKEYLGQQFKSILQKKAQYYDGELKGVMEGFAGIEFAKANRNIAILKSALRDFIKVPNFPKEEEKKILDDLMLLEQNDPLPERMNHFDTDKIDKQNTYAIAHNNEFTEYKSSIMKLLFDLKNVLPESMYNELLSRNGMFAGLLSWVDPSQLN